MTAATIVVVTDVVAVPDLHIATPAETMKSIHTPPAETTVNASERIPMPVARDVTTVEDGETHILDAITHAAMTIVVMEADVEIEMDRMIEVDEAGATAIETADMAVERGRSLLLRLSRNVNPRPT